MSVVGTVAVVLLAWTVLSLATATVWAAVLMCRHWLRERDRDALARAVGVLTVSGRR